MPLVNLTDVSWASQDQDICVYISRMWHQRGGFENGPPKNIHMVLTDGEGHHTHAMVTAEAVDKFGGILHERNQYKCSRFRVMPPAMILRPVEDTRMIWFTGSTIINRLGDIGYSPVFWPYELTSFGDLPPPDDTPARLVDVIGVVSSISDVAMFQPPQWTQAVPVRDVFLRDLSGREVKIRMWGGNAVKFNGSNIIALGSEDTAVVIFYGTTVRIYDGQRGLATGEATGWYINEDIPDVNLLYLASHTENFRPIVKAPIPIETGLRTYQGAQPPRTMICKLNNFNLYEKKASMFRCKARMCVFLPSRHRWYVYCSRCFRAVRPGRGSTLDAPIYECSQACPGVDPRIGYRLHLLCTDGTGQADFFLTDHVARKVVGASAMAVVSNNQPAGTLAHHNLFHAAAQTTFPPKEFKSLCRRKFRFVVRVAEDCFRSTRSAFYVQAVESFDIVATQLSSLDVTVPLGD